MALAASAPHSKLSLAIPAQKNAINRLAKGPAKATHALSRRGLLRLSQLTGTGLAQPNTNVYWLKTKINSGKITVPQRSMCLKGFNVTRPNIKAVLSPNLLATHP